MPTSLLSSRPPFEDLVESGEASMVFGPGPFDLVEVKEDGWYVEVHVYVAGVVLVGRSGAELAAFGEPGGETLAVLVGEYLHGTARTVCDPRRGNVVVFDCLVDSGRDLSHLPLRDRRTAASAWVAHGDLFGLPLLLAEQWSIGLAHAVWTARVERQFREGLVFKASWAPWGTPWGRRKRWVTRDYVCMGTNTGMGRRSIRCGLYVDGVLVHVCDVAGGDAEHFAGAREGRVLEVAGAEALDSGALRHGAFFAWRDDKPAQECVR